MEILKKLREKITAIWKDWKNNYKLGKKYDDKYNCNFEW